jgi:hypothetical protein
MRATACCGLSENQQGSGAGRLLAIGFYGLAWMFSLEPTAAARRLSVLSQDPAP